MDFADKIVLITGASRGIGRATAIEFAKRNATVVVNYHKNKEAAEEALEALPGGGHMLYQADVCDPQSVREMIEAIVSRYEKLDIVVNNAGLSIFHPIDEVNFNEWITAWRMTLEMNLIAPANVCYFAAQQMIEQGGGHIVNVSSRGAFRGEPTKPAYGASKAGLNAMSQSLAKKLAPHNISVGVVAPGFVETDMAKETLTDAELEAVKRECPLGRIAQPEEVAYAIAFLASKGAAFSTGTIIDVNGASYLRS